jgi:outer membrane immunogenic protein
MKKLLIAAAGLIALATPALAADMAPAPVYTKAPPPVVAVYNWTGFYIGISGGGDWGRASVFAGAVGLPITNGFGTNGGLVGGTVGYNYQVNKWVFGFEGDFSGVWSQGTGPDIPPFNPIFSQQVTENWLATARGRIGFLAAPQLLLYGTGGFAAADVNQKVSTNPPGCGVPGTLACTSISETQTMTGWTAGAGAEWKINQHWSVKGEYLYVDLGQTSFFNPAPVTPLATFLNDQRLRLHDNIVRVGVNYTFGGPVVAKY